MKINEIAQTLNLYNKIDIAVFIKEPFVQDLFGVRMAAFQEQDIQKIIVNDSETFNIFIEKQDGILNKLLVAVNEILISIESIDTIKIKLVEWKRTLDLLIQSYNEQPEKSPIQIRFILNDPAVRYQADSFSVTLFLKCRSKIYNFLIEPFSEYISMLKEISLNYTDSVLFKKNCLVHVNTKKLQLKEIPATEISILYTFLLDKGWIDCDLEYFQGVFEGYKYIGPILWLGIKSDIRNLIEVLKERNILPGHPTTTLQQCFILKLDSGFFYKASWPSGGWAKNERLQAEMKIFITKLPKTG